MCPKFEKTPKLIFQKDEQGQVVDMCNYLRCIKWEHTPQNEQILIEGLGVSRKAAKKFLHIAEHSDTKDLERFKQGRSL